MWNVNRVSRNHFPLVKTQARAQRYHFVHRTRGGGCICAEAGIFQRRWPAAARENTVTLVLLFFLLSYVLLLLFFLLLHVLCLIFIIG